MPKAKHDRLLEKSIQATVASIEIYNKPDFGYREETFSILMLNGWELLFKSKILKDHKGNLNSIYIPEKKLSKQGKPLKRFFAKKNRSGNPLTLDIFSSMKKLQIDSALQENITLLTEIRDNAIHFTNDSKEFEKIVLEIGTASLKSYVTLVNEWFGQSLENYNFYLMPISFFHTFELESFSINNKSKQQENFFAYVSGKLIDNPTDLAKEHNIALKLETKLEKSSSADALPVKYDKNSPIIIRQELESKIAMGLQNGSLYDHQTFVNKLQESIPGIKLNSDFYKKRKQLEGKEKYQITRYLDPIKKTGTPKHYWTSEALKAMKKLYD